MEDVLLVSRRLRVDRKLGISAAAAVVLIAILFAAKPSFADALEDGDAGGGAASDPTAAVNFHGR